MPPRTYRFPAGFLWGASTSSHQVEGGNRWNDWWESEERGLLPHPSGDACRQYELFERDFDLARAWGHNAHRLSIEWSRLEPAEQQWNTDAVRHYRRVLQALIDRGLEPVVTLHHFTNPAWFSRRGGWTRRDSPALFARYVNFVAGELGRPVKYWLTINEPTVYVIQGFVTGEWPPFKKGAWMSAGRVMGHLARAHVHAYRTLHDARPDVLVGFAHSAPVIEPCNAGRRRDRVVAAARDFILNELFFRRIGSRGAGQMNPALDFVGINYYTRNIVRFGSGLGALVGRVCSSDHHDRGPLSTMGWEVYPGGMLATLKRFSRYGLPLLVTENGIATGDETLRRRFLLQHVAAAGEAIEQGVRLIGYLYWSLIDNFEWALGTAPRFGLAAVDYATQERRARPCVADFSQVCRDNQLSIETDVAEAVAQKGARPESGISGDWRQKSS
jgi:beta-glucosidase